MEQVFNKERALKRTMNDEELLAELLDFSLEDLELQFSQIRKAVEDQQREVARKAAHKLKGTAGAIGADKLFQQAFLVEQQAPEAEQEHLLSSLELLGSAIKELQNNKTIQELRSLKES